MAARPRAAQVLLAVWCGILFFHGINAGDLWRAEGLRALVAADCLQNGDWIVPRLYGQPLLTKPPAMYLAIALASWPFGEVREWTARLPSALAATATVFLFFWYFARQLGCRAGLIAALLLPASVMWLDKAPLAEIDMLHVAWVSAAILFFLRALEAEETGNAERETRNRGDRSALIWWLAALLCVAGGVLTKWTAPTFFYLTVLAVLGRRRRLKLLLGWRHLVSAAAAAAVCLAWAAAATQRVGLETLVETVGREALARLVPDRYGRAYPWWEVPVYPVVIFVANLPWSAVALLTLWPRFARLWDERGRRLLEALHCWLWPNVCLWSLVSEHAPRHGFPMYPAIAGLAALVWIAWLDGRLTWPLRRLKPASVFVGLLVVWLSVKLAFVQVVPAARNARRAPRAKGEQLARLVPEGRTLYTFGIKDRDEALLYYYGRPVRRLPGREALPASGRPVYCLLLEREWREWTTARPAEAMWRQPDELGDWLVLARVR